MSPRTSVRPASGIQEKDPTEALKEELNKLKQHIGEYEEEVKDLSTKLEGSQKLNGNFLSYIDLKSIFNGNFTK